MYVRRTCNFKVDFKRRTNAGSGPQVLTGVFGPEHLTLCGLVSEIL